MAVLRTHSDKVVLAVIAVVLFIIVNYYFSRSSQGTAFTFSILGASRQDPKAAKKNLDAAWAYKLNLTSQFVKITDKVSIL
jgi:hypothetical protein